MLLITAREAFASGLHLTAVICAVITLAVAVLAAFVLRAREEEHVMRLRHLEPGGASDQP